MTLDAIEFVRRFLMHVLPAGFVRIRGEMEVLGICSASIELHLELGYRDPSCAYGRAEIVLEISIAFFSASVPVSCEKSFGSASQDPTFADVMRPDGPYAPWNEYCEAFG